MNVQFPLRGLLLFAALAPPANAFAQASPEACGSRPANLPLAFVENQGQWEDDARFTASTGQLVARFEADAVVLCRRTAEGGAVLRLSFEGVSDATSIEGETPLPGVYNFFVGEPSTWRTGVRSYESLLYRGIYDRVDLRVRDQGGELKYDVLLDRAADLDRVVVRCDGADGLKVGEDGSLVLSTPQGEMIQPKPETWQVLTDGERRAVECRYRRIDEVRYGFEAPEVDPDLPLVVDPGIDWSTFLGGTAFDLVNDVAIADNGDVVACGRTYSMNFPTTSGAYSVSNAGAFDAFVVRMDPAASGPNQLKYSTYLGGNGTEHTRSVSVDGQGVITLVGRTEGGNFPVTPGAYDTSPNGSYDVFVCQLDPSQNVPAQQLIYSTFIGGQANDWGFDHHVSSMGIITVVGQTEWAGKTGFPTTPNAFCQTHNGGKDVFVLRLDPNLTLPSPAQLLYSTFVGGSGDEFTHHGTSVDQNGVVTVVGWTSSIDFPTKNAYQSVHNGGYTPKPWDAFVVRIDPGQPLPSQLVYGTYLGGSEVEEAWAGTVDHNGDVIVATWTISGGLLTTPGAYQQNHANPGTATVALQYFDCYVARLRPSNPPSQQLEAATYLGGTSVEGPMGVAVDGSGTVILAGQVGSSNFPTTPGAFDQTFNGGVADSFVARLDRNFERLLYSTYIGGFASGDYILALAVDESVAAVVGGWTYSWDYPITSGAFPYNGNADGFLTKLDLFPTGADPYGASTPGCRGPIAIGVNSMPQQGNAGFGLMSVNSPPKETGYLLVSLPPPLSPQPTIPVPIVGVDLWVFPGTLLPLLSVKTDARGYCEVPVPLPAGTAGTRFYAQFVWLPNPCGPQQYSASNAVDVTIQ